jgi:hypothetical protein
MPGIDVISPIPYRNTNLETSFRRGVGNAAWCDAADPIDSVGYDPQALANAVNIANDDDNVTLIVTVGGLATASAALQNSNKPFLSIAGGTNANFPGDATTGNFYGGVNLNTFAQNEDRFQYLIDAHSASQFHCNASEVCLLVRTGGAVTNSETALWPFPPRGRIFRVGNYVQIARAFSAFAGDGTLKAMIVSSDPFFHDHKEWVIANANQADKYMCFPFQEFGNAGGSHQPKQNKHTKHGPWLFQTHGHGAGAYERLGQLAASVISTGNRQTYEPAQPEKHDG